MSTGKTYEERLRELNERAALLGISAARANPRILRELEVFWRDNQPWLEERGYQLRPRYHPNWTPSWPEDTKPSSRTEDALRSKRGYMVDATRISDGQTVMLKSIITSEHPFEVPTNQFLSSPELASDPSNHCSPIYEVLHAPGDDDRAILVMPFLRPYNDPPMSTVHEAVEFFHQVIEGLLFMHKHRVAHRDCSGGNIMYDPTPIFPDGYHPVLTDRSRNLRSSARRLNRSTAKLKYYLIDFGISYRFDPSATETKVLPIGGADSSPPEHARVYGPQDPFPTDVYYLGNMIRKDFLKKYSNLEFMSELVDSMVANNPESRPKMDDVYTQFQDISSGLTHQELSSRLLGRSESAPQAFVLDVTHRGSQLFTSAFRMLSSFRFQLFSLFRRS